MVVMLEVFRVRTSVRVPLVRGLKRKSGRFVSIPEGPEIHKNKTNCSYLTLRPNIAYY